MLAIDLEAAGIATETDSGVVDVHALRGTYITHLVNSGASVKACQTLARHSTPVLTIGVYAKTSLHDLTGAVEALPDLTPSEPAREREFMQATGTDGQHIRERFADYLPNEGDGNGRDHSDIDGMIQGQTVRGAAEIRTRDGGFADLCLTTWLRRRGERSMEIGFSEPGRNR